MNHPWKCQTMCIITAAITCFAWGLQYTHAQYILPSANIAMKTITHAVDATVEGFDEHGYAQLKTHALWFGDQTPTYLDGVAHSCFPGSLQGHVKVGERYVFLVQGSKMFEERSRFPVHKEKDGSLTVDWGDSDTRWLGIQDREMSYKDARNTMLNVRAKYTKPTRSK